jgi:hypothetical protein
LFPRAASERSALRRRASDLHLHAVQPGRPFLSTTKSLNANILLARRQADVDLVAAGQLVDFQHDDGRLQVVDENLERLAATLQAKVIDFELVGYALPISSRTSTTF